MKLTQFKQLVREIAQSELQAYANRGRRRVTEAANADFEGPGLVVIGLTDTDDMRLQKFIDSGEYYGVWNSQEKYAFFPEEPDMLDALESELSKSFKQKRITARFESQD